MAFLVSPLAVPIVFTIGNVALTCTYRHGAFDPAGSVFSFCLACVYSLPIAYCAELLFGLPIWLVFRRFRIQSAQAYVLAAGLIGLISFQLISFLGYQSAVDSIEYLLSPSRWINLPNISAVVGGLLGGVAFWYISTRFGVEDRTSTYSGFASGCSANGSRPERHRYDRRGKTASMPSSSHP